MQFSHTQKIFISSRIKGEINSAFKLHKCNKDKLSERERIILNAVADAILNLPSPEE